MPCFRYIEIKSPSDLIGEGAGGDISPFAIFTEPFPNLSGSTLTWTKNGGAVPSDISGRFEVYEDGRRLEYPHEFTVNTSPPLTAVITLLYPNTGSYYFVKATFINNA